MLGKSIGHCRVVTHQFMGYLGKGGFMWVGGVSMDTSNPKKFLMSLFEAYINIMGGHP